MPSSKINFLNIDLEGADFEALNSLDFNIYRPKLICVEIYDEDIEKSNINAVGMLSRKNFDTSLTDFSGKTIFDYSNLSRNISIKRILEKLKDF